MPLQEKKKKPVTVLMNKFEHVGLSFLTIVAQLTKTQTDPDPLNPCSSGGVYGCISSFISL